MIIAVDFDGTLVEHRFPEIGAEVPGAFFWLQKFQAEGARLILWTMRSDLIAEARSDEGHLANRGYLGEAVAFCRSKGIEFWGINENPEQWPWTKSPKPYAHLYIDDASFGCPLLDMGPRKCVDWSLVGPAVIGRIRRSLEAASVQ